MSVNRFLLFNRYGSLEFRSERNLLTKSGLGSELSKRPLSIPRAQSFSRLPTIPASITKRLVMLCLTSDRILVWESNQRVSTRRIHRTPVAPLHLECT
jgi:hypothetical protein